MIFDIHTVMKRYDMEAEEQERALRYLKALKYIIGADGDIAEAEWAALNRWMQRHNLSQELVQAITDFDASTVKDLGDILPNYQKDSARARSLIHDAIEIARADGVFAEEENAAVQFAAKILGVAAETVIALEALVEMEAGVEKLRTALLSRKDNP